MGRTEIIGRLVASGETRWSSLSVSWQRRLQLAISFQYSKQSCYDAHLDSNENRFQDWPLFSTRTGWIASPANREMTRAQKRQADTFDCITRTSHMPGNVVHRSWAICFPIPCLRYLRTTKNSAMSQTVSFPESSDPFFTKANPASWPPTLTRKGAGRADSNKARGCYCRTCRRPRVVHRGTR